MIIIAHVICNDECVESTLNREENQAMTVSNKAVIVGGFILFFVVLSAVVLYGASQEVYVDVYSLTLISMTLSVFI
jgi:hypothetical protein